MASGGSASRCQERAQVPRRSRGGNSRLKNSYGRFFPRETEAQRRVTPPRGNLAALNPGVPGAPPALGSVCEGTGAGGARSGHRGEA